MLVLRFCYETIVSWHTKLSVYQNDIWGELMKVSELRLDFIYMVLEITPVSVLDTVFVVWFAEREKDIKHGFEFGCG